MRDDDERVLRVFKALKGRRRELFRIHVLASLVLLVHIAIAGLGTRDAAFVALLLGANVAAGFEHAILAATFTYALVTIVLPAIVGLPLMVRQLVRL